MSLIGWNQWSYSELMSMHGVEDEDSDDDIDCDEDFAAKTDRCDCSNCMYCLGLSWRDFM
jgi:hypothetical protein